MTLKQLRDGQEIRIALPNNRDEGLIQVKCCSCGLQHKLYVRRDGIEVRLSFVRVATRVLKAVKKKTEKERP